MLEATETTHGVHQPTTARARARISKQKVLNGRGEVANRQHVEALRGTGENLVSEQTREMEEGTNRDYRTCKQEQLYFEWQPYCRAYSNTCEQNQCEEHPCLIVLSSHISMSLYIYIYICDSRISYDVSKETLWFADFRAIVLKNTFNNMPRGVLFQVRVNCFGTFAAYRVFLSRKLFSDGIISQNVSMFHSLLIERMVIDELHSPRKRQAYASELT